MSETKRYYWLKLKNDFFSSKRIKKLRRLAGGDTYTIIYLKLQLLALQNNGLLEFTGLEDSFAEELALDIDESPDDVNITVNYLLSCGLAESSGNDHEILLPYVVENTGSEGASALRVREFRAREKSRNAALPVGSSDTDITALPGCDDGALQSNFSVTESKRKNKSKSKSKKEDTDIDDGVNDMTPDRCPDGAEAPAPKKKRFTAPDIDSFKAYCLGNSILDEYEAEKCFYYYSSQSWKKSNGVSVSDWKAVARTWRTNLNKYNNKGDTDNNGRNRNNGDQIPEEEALFSVRRL